MLKAKLLLAVPLLPFYHARTVSIDWDNTVRISQTVTTLQVVSNPILEPVFTTPDGQQFPNPIFDQAWASLEALEAENVRYVPWFPYPQVSVAELEEGKWSFEHILPQLEAFMNATYSKNHTTVINFSTQPCWLFGDIHNQPQNCSVPANPAESFDCNPPPLNTTTTKTTTATTQTTPFQWQQHWYMHTPPLP
jgi:hypothetical protein